MSHEFVSVQEQLRSVEEVIAERPEIVGLQSYEYLRNNEHEQRAAFMDDPNVILVLSYPELETGSINHLAAQTRDVLLSLGTGQKSEKIDSLYASVEYRYSEMSLIDLARQMNDPNLSESERQEAIDWFKATNEALYGKPEVEVFNGVAQTKLLPHLEADFGENTQASHIQGEIRQLLGAIGSDAKPSYKPDETTLQRIHGLVSGRFEKIVEHIDPEKTYEVLDICDAIDIALEKLGGKELGWKVVVAKNSASLSTSAHQRLLEVGENRKAILGAELKGKVLHEAGIHALRSINAEQAGWLSAAYGQEGYLPFEEAAATALEDAYSGKFVDHGQDYYLIAGLAYGLDNHDPRDFREVFEIMWRKNALAGAGEVTDESIAKAKSKAFTNCMRMFRGTTTTDAGIIYSKDLAYFVGQELAWSVLDGIETQADFELIVAGKLDLTKESHVAIARTIVYQNKQA